MQKKTALLLLGSVLIVATFLRLYHFKNLPPGLYPDEAVNATNAVHALTTGDYRVFYPENNGREGLFMNMQALSLKFFGVYEPWSLRFPSAIIGILTVLGIFLLGRELFNTQVGLFASLFAATSFWHITFSRIGFRAITAPFFLVFAIAFLLMAIRWAKEPRLRNFMPYLFAVLGGLSFGLGFYSYISYRTAPLLLIPFLFF
ncbi:MAG: glycosyltransferase family 39 protein, partial [Candidatus Liptonbacteria bacterium]